jgi:hypothetical protein
VSVLSNLRAGAPQQELGIAAQASAADHDEIGLDLIGDRQENVDDRAIVQDVLDVDIDLVRRYRHLTARDAAWIAAEGRARRLVLAHFSQPYHDDGSFGEAAAEVFPDVVVARDLITVPVPSRECAPAGGGRPTADG